MIAPATFQIPCQTVVPAWRPLAHAGLQCASA